MPRSDTPRRCYYCREPYYRCEKIAVWTVRNPGHRTGWTKKVISACLNCSGIASLFNRLSGRPAERRRAA